MDIWCKRAIPLGTRGFPNAYSVAQKEVDYHVSTTPSRTTIAYERARRTGIGCLTVCWTGGSFTELRDIFKYDPDLLVG